MKRNPFSVRRIILIFFVCIMSSNIFVQKANLESLSINQLIQYKDKANTMRKTGRILTLSGVGVMVTGFATGAIMLNTAKPHGPPEDPHGSWAGLYVMCLAGLVGIPCSVVGIPLWAVGGNRKAKAEFTLQKFNLAPENSMAVGLGIRLRF